MMSAMWTCALNHLIRILVLLQILQSTIPMPMNANTAAGLQKWMIDGGAYIHPSVQIEYFPGLGYGLKAIEAVPASEMLCIVPEHLCLHSKGGDFVLHDVLLHSMAMKYFSYLTEYALEEITTHLARELKKGLKSAYYPFLVTLPDDVSFIPARWSDEKILEMDIDGTQTEADLRSMRNKWHNDAHKWLSLSPGTSSMEVMQSESEEVSVSDWVWARATLQARGFSFRGKHKESSSPPPLSERDGEATPSDCDDQNVVSFIPFITLSNHDDSLGGVTTMGADPVPSSSFTFRSGPATPKGEQLFNFYGEMSFQQKILSFGWVDRCLVSSPEAFSITALSVLRDWDEDISAEQRNSIIDEKEEKEAMQLEIRTNIHLGTAMADRRRSGSGGESPLTNELSLKITSLKFDIRNMIARVVGEKGGRDRVVAVAELMRSLTEREGRLLGGVRTPLPLPLTSLGGTADVPASKSQIKQQPQRKQVRQKAKVRQTSKESESRSSVQSTSSSSSGNMDGSGDGREGETDGQRIRRLELESVQLLLQFLPLC